MKIPLQGNKEEFDVQKFLTDQGLTLKGTSGKYAETPILGKENAVFRVVDKDGQESDFDAFKFMEDNGAAPDKEGYFNRQQTQQRAMADAQQGNTDRKLQKELEDAGMGEYFMRTAAPYTYSLFKSGKDEGIMGVPRKGLAVTADVFSLLPRGVIGAYEGMKKHLTGKGRDLGEEDRGHPDSQHRQARGRDEVKAESRGQKKADARSPVKRPRREIACRRHARGPQPFGSIGTALEVGRVVHVVRAHLDGQGAE